MDHRTVQLLLRVLASPTAVLTESQMLAALELSGIVGNPAAIKAMEFAAGQASANSPATLVGFATTLQNLIKLNPDHKPADYAALEAYVKQITASNADAPMTFGMFQTLMSQLPAKPFVPVKPAAAPGPPAAPRKRARRAVRKAAKNP